jgi:hypothetical protein
MQTMPPPPGDPLPAPGAAANSTFDVGPPQIPQIPQTAPSYGPQPSPRPVWPWAVAAVAVVAVLVVLGVSLAMWVGVQQRLDDQSQALARRIDESAQRRVETVVAPTVPPTTLPEQPPEDPAVERERITAAYLAAFSIGTADAERVAAFGGDATLRPKFGEVVTGIHFTNPDTATVTFAFQSPGIRALGYERSADIPGTATRTGDTWVVAPDALDNAMQRANAYCG